MDNAFIAAARNQGLNGVWRYLLGLILVFFLWILGGSCVLLAGMATNPTLGPTQLNSPVFLALQLLSFAFIPLGLWLVLCYIHRRPFFTLINPAGRFAWRRFWFGASAWLILSALSDLILSQVQPGNYTWTFNLQAFLPYLVITLLLIPLQAASEELLFRGYMTQGLGQVHFWLAWIAPAVFFGLLHSLNPEVDAYGFLLSMPVYIGVGLLFGWVTLRSQSLEMSIGMHIANNLYSSLMVTFPSSALSTQALFTIQKYDALLSLAAFVASALIYVLIFETIGRGMWKKGILLLGSILLVVLLSGCGLARDRAATKTSLPSPTASGTVQPIPFAKTIRLEDCFLDVPGSAQIKARCGTYEVPENRSKPAGRKISLYVVVVKAESSSPEVDPVFLLAGGPGQSAVDSFRSLLNALDKVRFKRDLVMVDQRGTGKSNPLNCVEQNKAPDVITSDIPLEEQMAQMDTCLAMLKKENDLTQYNTRIAMQDLEEVRQALGYGKINLLGVSYGTRAALAYQSLYPDAVRSVVLDGVVPPGWGLGSTMRSDAQRSLDLIFQRCKDDSTCNEHFPNLKIEFYDLLSNLQSKAVEMDLPNPVTGETLKVSLTPLMAESTVRMMSYSDLLTALMPLMIHEADQGDYTMLASQYVLDAGSLGDSISIGMYYSVWCYEDYPLLPKEGELGNFYFNLDPAAWQETCSRWPAMTGSAEIPAPSNTKTPLLILSGEDDPVTPPANGDKVAKAFPQSLHLVLSGMGHGNFYVGCMPTILRDFYTTASVKDLQTECIQDIHPMPFFLSPTGPKP